MQESSRDMTDEQLKVLAELVLLHDERLAVAEGILHDLIEQNLDAGKDGPNANYLRHKIEQLAGLARDADKARELTRRYFGLG